MIEPKFVERIAEELSVTASQIANAIELLDGGATIPFIARYRKDQMANLTEAQLETVADRNTHFTALTNRRHSILQAIEKQGKLTKELRAKLEACFDRAPLEDLYRPYKKRRPTKATVARQKGLGALAERLLQQDDADRDIDVLAQAFVRPEKAVSSVEEALDGARNILSEQIVLSADVRGIIRERMLSEGRITARSTKNAEGKKTKFEAYYDFSESVAKIPSHRILAILRGVKLGVLRMDLTIDDERIFNDLLATYVKQPGSSFESIIRHAFEEAYHRHLRPALEHEVVEVVRNRAVQEAIRVFGENTRNLLLAPPAGSIVVLGVNPGLRTGCGLAALDGTGALLESQTIYPNEPANDVDAAEKVVLELVQKHHVEAIAIGNGTAARETGQFFKRLLAKQASTKVFCAFVSETGAAAYSTAKMAKEEFPNLDVSTRTAVSIARRLQDPLCELVKIEPRQIGVGQYQHDLNQRQLRDGLNRTVVSCVNHVGVDLNTASVELLRYISGIQMGVAQDVIAYRKQVNGFTSRQQLTEVTGVGPKVFEQCAGFLRIRDGENPLDATAIHPEAYPVVEKMAQSLGVPVSELIRNRVLIDQIDLAQFETDGVGPLALKDIRDELLKPGRDPRRTFKVPRFLEGIYSVDDLEEGMQLEGAVTNVTDFGAFVDIGMHQDGLVHLSQMAHRFVSDPREVVKVGEIVKVKVIKVDKEMPRISLSMKAVAPPKKRAHKPRAARKSAPPERPVDGTGGADAAPPGEERREATRDTKARPAKRQPRPRRTEDAESSRDRGPRRERPPRRGAGPRRPQRAEWSSDSRESLNTLLADQLAALRDKLKS